MMALKFFALLLSLLQANVIYNKIYNILRGGLLLRRPPAEETVSCRGGLLLRRPPAEVETASLQPIYLVFNSCLTSVLVEASAMMADVGGGPPERPGGKKGMPERDFRPDVDEEEEEDGLPPQYQRLKLRLHVHFSF